MVTIHGDLELGDEEWPPRSRSSTRNSASSGNDFAVDDLVFGLPGPIPPALMVTAQPGSVSTGADFGLTVTAENSSGSVDTRSTGPVTVALSNNPRRRHPRRHVDRDGPRRRGHVLRRSR